MNKKSNFVIQEHSKQGEPPHWDMMLQINDLLQTYRLFLPPQKVMKQKVRVERIPDHPLKFLTYEGSVNNGLGNVKMADCGTYTIVKKDKVSLQIQFNGEILKGKFTLAQVDSNSWEFTCTDNS